MTRLLISVRQPQEVDAALEGGAHLIDVKEPQRGPLGPPDPETLQAIVRQVNGRAPISVALGELREMGPQLPWLPPQVQLIKLGLAGLGSEPRWPQRLVGLIGAGHSCQHVAVAYADWQAADAPSPEQVLAAGKAIGCGAFLIDTFDKSHGDLFRYLSPAELNQLVRQARQVGMVVAVAGSLNLASAVTALAAAPDYLGFRRAACDGLRTGRISAAAVAQLSALLASTSRSRSSA